MGWDRTRHLSSGRIKRGMFRTLNRGLHLLEPYPKTIVSQRQSPQPKSSDCVPWTGQTCATDPVGIGVGTLKKRLAGAHGNRTHQEPVSRPLTGFEDRTEHQQRKRSPVMPIKDLRRTYQIRSVGPTGYLPVSSPKSGESVMGRQAKLRRKGEYWATDAGGKTTYFG
jgi:hypothetical protein